MIVQVVAAAMPVTSQSSGLPCSVGRFRCRREADFWALIRPVPVAENQARESLS
jgi:hypothetical protein